MPANRLIAGMARSYGCPAKSFSDKFQPNFLGLFVVVVSREAVLLHQLIAFG